MKNNAKELTEKGIASLKNNNYEEAINYFNKAIENVPDYSEAWYFKSRALSDRETCEEAIFSIDKAIEINPENSDYWYHRGYLAGTVINYDTCLRCTGIILTFFHVNTSFPINTSFTHITIIS